MHGTEHKTFSLRLAAWLAPLLFLLAAVATPVVSAKASNAWPNRAWENSSATARYESVGFIGQMHRHITTKTHIATGYAGGPTAISARRIEIPSVFQKPRIRDAHPAANHFGRGPPVQLPLNPRYDRDTQYDAAPDFCIAAESAEGGASSATQGQKLARHLTSEEQTGQALAGKGKPIFGAGTGEPLDNADRLAHQHGGRPEDWVKMRSESSAAHGVQTPSGKNFEVHWYQNAKTGKVVEIKTKITGH